MGRPGILMVGPWKEQYVKRFATIVGGALAAVMALASPVLAQYPPYPPQPGGSGSGTGGSGTGSSGGGDLAFTGADITLWMILAAVLIVAGVIAVLVGRRPAAES